MAKTYAWRWHIVIVAAAFLLIALVAVTRMYLGVHYLSDVIAAFAGALAWLALCLMGINTYTEYRAIRRVRG